MTDWDLLTPGIGLTSIGITGVVVSLSGIAKTFLDGMHAVSILVMFIGMIFLASGLFKDGFPSSGKAKSATFLTLGFLVTFGVAAAVTVGAQVPSIFAYIGLMLIIGIPATMLTVVSYRKPEYLKALGIIFIGGAIVAGITFYAFGLVAPKAPAPAEPAKAITPTPAESPKPANIVKAEILAGASSQTNPDFDPDPIVASKGDGIEWTNNDNVPHTVTSKDKLFDSGIIQPKGIFLLETGKLAEGDYAYYCTLHPFMNGKLTLKPTSTAPAGTIPVPTQNNTNGTSTAPTAAATVTSVMIAPGASTPTNKDFFVPASVQTTVGSMVTWTNGDSTLHTVTSGKVVDSKQNPDGTFDSKFLKAGATYSFVFDKVGEYDYFCSLHPYMNGKVTVK